VMEAARSRLERPWNGCGEGLSMARSVILVGCPVH
jgi:hypothetical protein